MKKLYSLSFLFTIFLSPFSSYADLPVAESLTESFVLVDSQKDEFQKETSSYEVVHHDPLVKKLNDKDVVLEPSIKARISDILGMVDMTYEKAKLQDLFEESEKKVKELNNPQTDIIVKARLTKEIDDIEKQLTYFVGKLNNYQKKFGLADWKFIPFAGKTGYKTKDENKAEFKEDEAGFIAVHDKLKLIFVCWHGSRNGFDWKTNFDGRHIPMTFLGGVEVHRGFGNRVEASHKEIESLLDGVFEKIPSNERAHYKIVVTGHSQGAALSTLSQLRLALWMKTKQWFGPKFKNSVSNNIYGIHFSCPRSLTEGKAIDLFNEEVGPMNSLTVNVNGDPVPLASMKGAAAETLKGMLKTIMDLYNDPKTQQQYLEIAKKTPVIGKYVEEALSRAQNYIADNKGTLEEYLKTPQINDLLSEFNEKGENIVHDLTGYGRAGQLALVSPNEAIKNSLKTSAKPFWERFERDYALCKNDPVKRATLRTKLIGDLVVTNFAGLHAGSTADEEAGAAFHPAIFPTDFERLIRQGNEYLDKKEKLGKKDSDPIAGLFKNIGELAQGSGNAVFDVDLNIGIWDKISLGLKHGLLNYAGKPLVYVFTLGYGSDSYNKWVGSIAAKDIVALVTRIVGDILYRNQINLDPETALMLKDCLETSLTEMLGAATLSQMNQLLSFLRTEFEMMKKKPNQTIEEVIHSEESLKGEKKTSEIEQTSSKEEKTSESVTMKPTESEKPQQTGFFSKVKSWFTKN